MTITKPFLQSRIPTAGTYMYIYRGSAMAEFFTALIMAACACGHSAGLYTPAEVDHIVFFMIDDYGFADASYKADMYNGTNPPPTPNIDALAKSGVRLESYYVNKLCSPTRTAFLSGRYAYTIGMHIVHYSHDASMIVFSNRSYS